MIKVYKSINFNTITFAELVRLQRLQGEEDRGGTDEEVTNNRKCALKQNPHQPDSSMIPTKMSKPNHSRFRTDEHQQNAEA